MSLSNDVLKLIGLILAVVGALIILALVGFNPEGLHPPLPVWAQVIAGVALIYGGAVLVKGGIITL